MNAGGNGHPYTGLIDRNRYSSGDLAIIDSAQYANRVVALPNTRGDLSWSSKEWDIPGYL